ncbi:MAG TPA: hypothetical protein VE890_14650, partial [Thermoguttaceae bacterium]|nr:hypothetical protein [Thermoguttaceae bacterium]
VEETFEADVSQGVLSVQQRFHWASFDDDWKTSSVKAAPLPPMLALALGGNVPVAFFAGGRQVRPVDYDFMDTPGKAMGIEGGDSYEYRITGLQSYVTPRPADVSPSPETAKLREKLQRHVADMVDAGRLAPLFYIYGGIGGPRPGFFYWAGSPELARTLEMAYPHLSEDLQGRVVAYLRQQWQINPPWPVALDKYTDGTNRAPYEVPWEEMGREIAPAHNRERKLRTAHAFGDLYGIDAYARLTGESPEPQLRQRIEAMAGALLETQDWALSAPVRAHTSNVDAFSGGAYYERNGQAAANGWLAGSLGMIRLAKRLQWPKGEKQGLYLLGKLAMARIGQARYTAEMHRMGLVDGSAMDDYRTLVHIDRTCAIILRGNIKPVVFEDQELPPLVDLVEPVGRLLGTHAKSECRIYLDHLDRSMPLWYISEAPKQSASEQRLCPLQYKNGNVLAQSWILGKRGRQFLRYVDTTRFRGDLYYLENLAAAIDAQP